MRKNHIQAARIQYCYEEPNHTLGDGNEIPTAFENTYKIFEQRITKMLTLPLNKMNSNELAKELNAID